MIVKFLDKFGKLVKSITSIGYLPVDVEPVKDSKHLSSSGAVANIGSSIAPEYTKKTYEANSYVMYGGILYTNPNAIGTAEDWNPAHWTVTTVADMVANSGGGGGSTGYTQHDIDANYDGSIYSIDEVSNRSVSVVSSYYDPDISWDITIDDDCTDAIIILTNTNNTMKPPYIDIQRQSGGSLSLYGTKGQIASGAVEEDSGDYIFTPSFNGLNEEDQCSEVVIHICGNIALLSFTAYQN